MKTKDEPPSIREALFQYERILDQSSTIAASTASNYRSRMRLFWDFVREFADPDSQVSLLSSPEVVGEYVDYLRQDRSYKNGTINAFLAAHRHFSLTMKLETPAYPRKYACSTAEEHHSGEAARVYAAIHALPAREQCLISLLLFTDLRSEEIRALKMRDIVVSSDQLKVQTCRNRVVTSVASDLIQSVVNWCEYRGKASKLDSCDSFLLNCNGTALSSVAVHWMVRRLGWKLKMSLNVRTLRTMAHHLNNKDSLHPTKSLRVQCPNVLPSVSFLPDTTVEVTMMERETRHDFCKNFDSTQ